MSNRAWVTLATNDSYGLGALVLANSLRRAGSQYPAVVLITPSVTDAMRERLRSVFVEVVTVDVLDSRDAAHLALLQRPELGITFTKIHCWSLVQYDKCVFLDADTLVVQNCDELFEREELSAAPDVGWPDCFNSGVFVFHPSNDTFSNLIKFAQERGSFDGGDQGLLNSFFSDWAAGDITKHLPFLYNVTSAAFYSYIPALKHYGQNLKIIHFIGIAKPWLQPFNWQTRSVEAPDHLREYLQLWWDLFVSQVHPQLETSMTGVAGNLAKVVPGEAGYQIEALDELTRRQGWEAGNIDYMGADSFENIWAKISQTLNQPQPQKQASPPKDIKTSKQPSPPKDQCPKSEVPAAVETSTPKYESKPEEIVKEEPKKTEKPVPATPPATPKSTPEPSTPVAEETPPKSELLVETTASKNAEPTPATLVSPAPAAEAQSSPPSATDAALEVLSDSPPLANTPSKEETPAVPAAKSTEEAAQETRL